MLGKSKYEYCSWIMKPETWGGEIEISILAEHFSAEICVIAIESMTYKIYGEGGSKRIFLLYDGIHYDAITRNFQEDGPKEIDITTFEVTDTDAVVNALYVGKQLKEARKFTNTSSFTLLCMDCNTGLKGQEDAVQHGMTTGHQNFRQV